MSSPSLLYFFIKLLAIEYDAGWLNLEGFKNLQGLANKKLK